MNGTKANATLHLEKTTGATGRRLIFSAVCLIIFTLLWAIVPSQVLYWLLLLPLGILTWMASNGWRQSLHIVHEEIHHLEES